MAKAGEAVAGYLGETNSENYSRFMEIFSLAGCTIDEESFAVATRMLWELPDGRTMVLAADTGDDVGVKFLDQALDAREK